MYIVNSKSENMEKNKIKEFIFKIDNMFPVPLSEKININEYCDKILKKGICIVEKDENGDIIGLITGYVNDTENKLAYISTLCILPEYQNRHIGTQLLNKFFEIAKQNKMEKIFLYTHKNNTYSYIFDTSFTHRIYNNIFCLSYC